MIFSCHAELAAPFRSLVRRRVSASMKLDPETSSG